MSIEMLIYCPPMEEGVENVTGWDKETINFVMGNESRVKSQIRGIAKVLRRKMLQSADVDDIYTDLLMYLYKCDDYNLTKAIERSSSDRIVSIEGYLNTFIKCCVQRKCTEMYNREKGIIYDTQQDPDDDRPGIMESIPDGGSDDHFNSVVFDLRGLCKSCESIRYKNGPDIYQIWFIRLLTLHEHKDSLFNTLLSIVDVSRKELSLVEKLSAEDDLMTAFAKAIEITGVEEAIEIIRPYVYSSSKLEETIHMYN